MVQYVNHVVLRIDHKPFFPLLCDGTLEMSSHHGPIQSPADPRHQVFLPVQMTTTQESSRVALITGGASGIGRRIAEGLALQRGISVYIVDKDASAAAEVALAISAAGGRAKSCV